MCRPRLEKRIGPVRDLGRAQIADIHRFSKSGADGTAKGNIEVSRGDRVLGVVYQLAADQLDALAVEGGYRRLVIAATAGAGLSDAVTFVARSPSRQIPAPTSAYLEHYRRGIEQHDIGLDYYEALVAELQRRS
jgi:hypothetical protein